MKRLIVTIAVAWAGICSAVDVEVLRAGTAHEALFALDFAGTQGVAVGAAGAIFESSDAGETWEPIANSPLELSLLGVAVTPSLSIAVGQMGSIALRDTTGVWTTTESGTTERLLQIAIGPSGLAVAVGAFGTVLISDANGSNWRAANPDWTEVTEGGFQPHLYAAHIAQDGAITLAGEFGLILRSEDAGESWNKLHEGEASLFAMDLLANGTGYAVGQSSTILKTTDGGNTWAPVAEPGKVLWLGVSATDGGKNVAVTGMREMVTSANGGASWARSVTEPVGALWFLGVDRAKPQHAISVGQAGYIIKIKQRTASPAPAS